MEQKKSEKANLQSKKFIFLEIGLVLTLLAIWGVFEFNTKAENSVNNNQFVLKIDDDIIEIPVTTQQPPQPPAPPAPKVIDQLLVTPDDDPVEDPPINAEIDANAAVQIQEIVPVACTEEVPEEPTVIFVTAEVMPEFKGGDRALLKYIAEHVQYPEMAKDNDIQGTVFVKFVVNELGKVTDVELLKGIDPLLDTEALKVIKSLPDWKPGSQSGRNVKVRMQVPIKFQLAN